MELKERLQNLPLPVQLLVNMAFIGLLAVDLAIPDILPFVDEILISWLAYTGISAMVASRRGGSKALPDRSSVDVRDQQDAAVIDAEIDDAMQAAAEAEAEVEAIEGSPF